jgi:uncharacterized protein (TIGR03086 family)
MVEGPSLLYLPRDRGLVYQEPQERIEAMESKQVTVPTRQLNRAFMSTRAILAEVQPDQLDMPTPCASWDVRALINHFVGTARWAAATIGAGDEVADEDYVAGDFLASYDASIHVALAAFDSSGALEKTVQLPFGEFSGIALMGIATGDQFTHGWDLASAIGHHTDLDPELANELLIQAQTAVPESFRWSDGLAPFGPIVDAPAGACPADRLAGFLGRSM